MPLSVHPGVLRDLGTALDRVAGDLNADRVDLWMLARSTQWDARACDRIRQDLSRIDAGARTASDELRAAANTLRNLSVLVDEREADMRAAHDRAQQGLFDQAYTDGPEASVDLSAALQALPPPNDPHWARQLGRVSLPVPSVPAAGQIPLGPDTPPDTVDVDRPALRHLSSRIWLMVGANTGPQATRARTAADQVDLPSLDVYLLPGSTVDRCVTSATGPLAILGGLADAWLDEQGRIQGLLTLLDQADQGMIPTPSDALLSDPRTEDVLALLRRLEVWDGPAGAREALAGHTADEIAWLIEHTPGLAQRLASTDGTTPPDPALYRALPAEERRRLALLFPGSIGPLNGAPATDRAAANRVLIRAALADAHELLVRREREGQGRPSQDALGVEAANAVRDFLVRNTELPDWFGSPRDPESPEQIRVRIAQYTGFLNDLIPNPDRRPGQPATVPRQFLLFDPTADRGQGRVAELFGTIDADTVNVAFFVPGTGASLVSYGDDDRLTTMRAELPPGTALVGWIGGDMPDSIPEAAFPLYAETAAPDLRDFVQGIDGLAPQALTTVAGFSYGGYTVGLAELAGMEVDRVLHIASAGTGVISEDQYPHDAERFSLVTPDDDVQWVDGSIFPLIPIGEPTDIFTPVESGVDNVNDRANAQMTSGHGGAFTQGSDALANIILIMTGGAPALRQEGDFDAGTHPTQEPGYQPERATP